jgi:hypothetical protein
MELVMDFLRWMTRGATVVDMALAVVALWGWCAVLYALAAR